MVRSFKKDFVFDTAYFQKIIPLKELQYYSLKDSQRSYCKDYWEIKANVKLGLIEPRDSAPSAQKEKGYRVFEVHYGITATGKQILRNIHFDKTGIADTAWVNCYRLTRLQLDSSFYDYEPLFDSGKIEKHINKNGVRAIWKATYETAGPYHIYSTGKPYVENFKNSWELVSFEHSSVAAPDTRYIWVLLERWERSKPPVEVSHFIKNAYLRIYDALHNDDTGIGAEESYILVPPKLQHVLQAWVSRSNFL